MIQNPTTKFRPRASVVEKLWKHSHASTLFYIMSQTRRRVRQIVRVNRPLNSRQNGLVITHDQYGGERGKFLHYFSFSFLFLLSSEVVSSLIEPI